MAKKIVDAFKPAKIPRFAKQGEAGFDNSRENIDPHIRTKVVSTLQGTIEHTPTQDNHIATKKYVDDNAGGAPEGTSVKSTGEVGGTKFLREDGDGTCSWQVVAGGGDVSKVGTPLNNQVAVWTGDGTVEGDSDFAWDGSILGVSGTFTLSGSMNVTGTVDGVDIAARDHDSVTLGGARNYLTIAGQVITLGEIDIGDDTNFTAGTNCTLSGDTLNVDDAFLKNDAADVGVGLTLTGDNSSADTAYVPMVLYNTDATPPAANTVPIGTIYIQYTA